jgi:hypothetical protein
MVKLIKLSALITLMLLAGCESETKTTTSQWILPPELVGCDMYDMVSSTNQRITVMKCPLSSVSTEYRSGKVTNFAQTVEPRSLKEIKIDELKAKIKQLELEAK